MQYTAPQWMSQSNDPPDMDIRTPQGTIMALYMEVNFSGITI